MGVTELYTLLISAIRRSAHARNIVVNRMNLKWGNHDWCPPWWSEELMGPWSDFKGFYNLGRNVVQKIRQLYILCCVHNRVPTDNFDHFNVEEEQRDFRRRSYRSKHKESDSPNGSRVNYDESFHDGHEGDYGGSNLSRVE